MEIDKDKMTLMRIAMRQAGNSGNIEAAYDALLRKVSVGQGPVKIRDTEKRITPESFPHFKYKKPKPAKGLFSPDQCMKILEAFILLDKYEPQNKTLTKAVKMAFGEQRNSPGNSGPYLITNGFLERQGYGPSSVWTILKNPDGTPYNRTEKLTITVLPAGSAYGYGEKEQKSAFNPAYRDHTR